MRCHAKGSVPCKVQCAMSCRLLVTILLGTQLGTPPIANMHCLTLLEKLDIDDNVLYIQKLV